MTPELLQGALAEQRHQIFDLDMDSQCILLPGRLPDQMLPPPPARKAIDIPPIRKAIAPPVDRAKVSEVR
ncbi:hypothetical protein [Streptomyces sp. 5-10]|uniref:hypothetical protein n=1 Tax=Streptomyces sp. 5-10 TaxID=878925 RepID=UPI00168B173C|nr:hypothetical protein [Streptomyces sp. 5-10]MBD3004858.1 hypothetical protein [Streptomyces sp. 5-10]